MMDYNDEIYSFDDKPKRKRHDDPTTWADAFKALGIFMAIMLIIGIVGNLVQYLIHGDKLDRYYQIMTAESAGNPFMNVEMFRSPVYTIVSLILGVVLYTFGLFVVYGLIHLFATKLFKGEGTLRGLIVRSNVWTTGTYIAVSITGMIWSFSLINNIVQQFPSTNSAYSMQTQTYSNEVMSQALLIYVIFGIAWIVWGVAVSRITARNYGLDFSKGCGSLVVMNVSLFVLFCAFSFALGMGMYALFTP